MEIHDRVHSLIDEMIGINRCRRKKEKTNSIRRDGGEVHYAINYCTITCDLGRRMGHTEYIRRNSREGCLVVTPHISVFKNVQADTVTPIEIKEGAMMGRMPYQVIFVNEPSNVFKGISREDFYSALARPNIDQIFILLGE